MHVWVNLAMPLGVLRWVIEFRHCFLRRYSTHFIVGIRHRGWQYAELQASKGIRTRSHSYGKSLLAAAVCC